jgi:hypothetical protein
MRKHSIRIDSGIELFYCSHSLRVTTDFLGDPKLLAFVRERDSSS